MVVDYLRSDVIRTEDRLVGFTQQGIREARFQEIHGQVGRVLHDLSKSIKGK